MDYRLLDAFVAVVRNESYSLAAKRLGWPKSTVSRYITELERTLGVHLLLRTTRRLSVTSAGQSLYERVEPLMSDLNRALSEMPERASDISGVIKVTTSVDFGVSVLTSIAYEFLQKNPKVTLELHVTNAAVDLVKDGFDVAVRMVSRRLKDSTLRVRKIGHVHLVLAASSKYLDSVSAIRHPRDLEDKTWVRFSSMTSVRLEGPSGTVKITPKGALVVDDMLALHQAVVMGAGLGLLPAFVWKRNENANALVHVLPKWQTTGTDVCLLWPASSYTPPKVTAFLDFLATRMKQSGLYD